MSLSSPALVITSRASTIDAVVFSMNSADLASIAVTLSANEAKVTPLAKTSASTSGASTSATSSTSTIDTIRPPSVTISKPLSVRCVPSGAGSPPSVKFTASPSLGMSVSSVDTVTCRPVSNVSTTSEASSFSANSLLFNVSIAALKDNFRASIAF